MIPSTRMWVPEQTAGRVNDRIRRTEEDLDRHAAAVPEAIVAFVDRSFDLRPAASRAGRGDGEAPWRPEYRAMAAGTCLVGRERDGLPNGWWARG